MPFSDAGVLAVQVCVCRAVHGSNALQRQIVVHHGEHTLLHLSTVPGVDDHLLTGGNVEGNAGLTAESQLLVVLNLRLGSVVDDEVRLEVLQLFFRRSDEHILDEMSLPCNLDDEADCHAGILVCAAETIDDEQSLSGQLLLRDLLDSLPGLLAHRMVIIRILRGIPPYSVLGLCVLDDVLVFRRTSGEDTSLDVNRAKFTLHAFLKTGKSRLGLLLKEQLVGRVVNNLLDILNAILRQIDICHCRTSFLKTITFAAFRGIAFCP